MSENVIDYGRAKIKAAAFIGAGQPDPASITDADIANNAAIKTTKLDDSTEIAALVNAETELTLLANLDSELTALAMSDLVAAVGTPAAYSVVAADLAAALVAAGLMEPSAP